MLLLRIVCSRIFIINFLETLNEREKSIYELRIKDKNTLKITSSKINESKQRIHQIEKKIKEKFINFGKNYLKNNFDVTLIKVEKEKYE